MVYRANVLSVMIASPSDVIEQRDDIRAILSNWNFVNGLMRSLVLMPVAWETHAVPDLSGRAQGLINDRLLANCDFLVGVFWTRLGTPTGDFESGTVEEITRHIDAGKPAMVYFSDAPVAPQLLDVAQYENVKKFKTWCFERGLVETFTNSDEFRNKFRSQLEIQLNTNSYLKGIIDEAVKEENIIEISELSAEAKELLVAAAADSSGHIMSFSSLGGKHIQANGQRFGDPSNPRSSALWEAALQELVSLGYVVPRGAKGEVFQITKSGYDRADDIKGAST